MRRVFAMVQPRQVESTPRVSSVLFTFESQDTVPYLVSCLMLACCLTQATDLDLTDHLTTNLSRLLPYLDPPQQQALPATTTTKRMLRLASVLALALAASSSGVQVCVGFWFSVSVYWHSSVTSTG